MKVQIVGTYSNTFTDKKTGETVSYGYLYAIGHFGMNEIGKYSGQPVFVIGCKPENIPDSPVPYSADVQFNQKGRLVDLEVLE